MKSPVGLILLSTVFSGLFSCSSQNRKVEKIQLDSEAKNTITIAFGSCNKHDLPQPLWEPILTENPDLWIWLGDNVYGDTHDMELLKSKYDSQYNQEDYIKVRENIEIIGIWDDHDYGINDGGINYAQKNESQQLMLDFLDEPENSERRNQKGAYASYTYGEGDQKIKIFLLDARYHRDTLERNAGAYIPNLEGTILGEEQWKWLESEFKNSEATINLIASGVQFIAEEHPYEKWANFPNEKDRLMKLIANSGIKSPVFISGDRHIAEVSKIQLPNGHDIYDITSSGMTHTWKEWKPEENKYRVAGDHIAELHYGLLNIDWENRLMIFSIKGEEQKLYLNQEISF